MNKKFFILILFLLFNFNLFSSETEPIKFDRLVPDNVKLIQGFGFNKIYPNDKSFNFKNVFSSNLYIYSPDLSSDLNSLFIKGFPEGKVAETWINKPYGYLPDKYKNIYPQVFYKEEREYVFIYNKIKKYKKNKKEGGIILYYVPDYYGKSDKKFGTLLVIISGIIPLVKKDDLINKDTNLAKFATYEEFGYDSLVIVQFILIDEKGNKLPSFLALLPNE